VRWRAQVYLIRDVSQSVVLALHRGFPHDHHADTGRIRAQRLAHRTGSDHSQRISLAQCVAVIVAGEHVVNTVFHQQIEILLPCSHRDIEVLIGLVRTLQKKRDVLKEGDMPRAFALYLFELGQ
jgi:hypothetical protein